MNFSGHPELRGTASNSWNLGLWQPGLRVGIFSETSLYVFVITEFLRAVIRQIARSTIA